MNRPALALLVTSALASTSAFAEPRNAQSLRTALPTAPAGPTACKDTPRLVYGFNPPAGPLIQHAKVVDVMYSPGNPFKTMLESYYKAITQSAYFDMLQEYNTTNYKISRGSFLTTFEDTNSATATASLSDAQVQSYLTGLINAKKVPAADNDTLYMIYFPSTVSISLDVGVVSCQQFCAYHSSYTIGNQLVRYGVMPDVTKAPCLGGCGPTTNAGFDSLTDVSSHELIEAVTDPDNGTGWYDGAVASNNASNCGEIGDICATGPTTEAATVNGYVVQKEWSNTLGCVVSNPMYTVNDFSVAVTQPALHVPAGGTASTGVTLTKTTGTADNATLSAVGLPTGLVAAFAPASVTSAGGTSMVTFTAAPTLMVGTTQKVTIKATGTTVSQSVDVTVDIVAPPDMAIVPDLAQPAGSGGNGNGSGSGNGSGNGAGNGSGGNAMGGCSVSGNAVGGGGGWAMAALLLLALATRRRRA